MRGIDNRHPGNRARSIEPALDTIIFDCEGVVVDSEPIWDLEQSEFLRRHGRVYDREIKSQLAGRSLLEGTRTLQHAHRLEGDTQQLAQERLAIVADLLANDVNLVPGFSQFFETVRHRYRTALATAMAPELLRIVDRRLGLADLFAERIYDVDTVGCRSKPYPDIFLHAADQLGVDPRNCAVIEDTPYGVEAARRAGMVSIGLTSTCGRDELRAADLVVDSFDEVSLPRSRARPEYPRSGPTV